MQFLFIMDKYLRVTTGAEVNVVEKQCKSQVKVLFGTWSYQQDQFGQGTTRGFWIVILSTANFVEFENEDYHRNRKKKIISMDYAYSV